MQIIIEPILLNYEAVHVHFDGEERPADQTLCGGEFDLIQACILNQQINIVHVHLEIING